MTLKVADVFVDEVLLFFERDAVDVFKLLANYFLAVGHGEFSSH